MKPSVEFELNRQMKELDRSDSQFYNQEEIDLILNAFDFESAHEIAEKNNFWVIGQSSDVSHEIPSVERMKKTARRLLESMQLDRGVHWTATARFHAVRTSQGKLILFYGPSSI